MQEGTQETTAKPIIYELAYLLRLGETEALIEAAIKDAGATITLKSPIEQITLAYPIAKQTTALFGFYQMTMPSGEAVTKIADSLRHKDAIIRSLMVKLPKVKPQPVRILPTATPEGGEPRPTGREKTPIMPSVTNIDSLSNEKLSATLEEILK